MISPVIYHGAALIGKIVGHSQLPPRCKKTAPPHCLLGVTMTAEKDNTATKDPGRTTGDVKKVTCKISKLGGGVKKFLAKIAQSKKLLSRHGMNTRE